MIKWSAYWRLSRFDKPAGILLLWYPTVWALWIANQGAPSLKLFCLFTLGTILMRAAGCVVNDIADRRIDKHVSRTKLRPITSGEVGLVEAFFLLFLLLIGALIIVLNLPLTCFYLSIVALLTALVYPFCKRFLAAPQMILGLSFSMGIPMAFVASDIALNGNFIILFIINFFWIVAYDTMYAITDKEDDLKIGVKSTAIYFANYDVLIIGLLLFLLHSLWFCWALMNKVELGFYAFWASAIFILVYQYKLINKREPVNCFKAFMVSIYYGLWMWFAVMAALL